jgi:RNA polymerase sigma factor (TIGR02999 family)
MSRRDGHQPLTELLQRWDAGDQDARDALVAGVYEELRAIAHRRLEAERGPQTLDTTSLVHETYLKLAGSREVGWESRAHFFSIAARQMRQILVDRARARLADKRGGGVQPATLDEGLIYDDGKAARLLDIDGALEKLAEVNERASSIVEMRFFVGMTMKEISAVIDASLATVERDWTMARAWLMRELAEKKA